MVQKSPLCSRRCQNTKGMKRIRLSFILAVEASRLQARIVVAFCRPERPQCVPMLEIKAGFKSLSTPTRWAAVVTRRK